jgi:hypothetical protein
MFIAQAKILRPETKVLQNIIILKKMFKQNLDIVLR